METTLFPPRSERSCAVAWRRIHKSGSSPHPTSPSRSPASPARPATTRMLRRDAAEGDEPGSSGFSPPRSPSRCWPASSSAGAAPSRPACPSPVSPFAGVTCVPHASLPTGRRSHPGRVIRFGCSRPGSIVPSRGLWTCRARTSWPSRPWASWPSASIVRCPLPSRARARSPGCPSPAVLPGSWSPRGDEVWYTASERGTDVELRSVDLAGHVRRRAGLPVFAEIVDFNRDGRALAIAGELRTGITALPPGETRERDLSRFKLSFAADLSGDGRTLLSGERGSGGKSARAYVVEVDPAGPPLRPLAPEGQRGGPVSPDRQSVAVRDPQGRILIYPASGGEPHPVPGPPEPGRLGSWSQDGRSLYVIEVDGLVARLYRRDLQTGRRELWKELSPPDPAGGFRLAAIAASDGRSYVYTHEGFRGSLYLVDGLK